MKPKLHTIRYPKRIKFADDKKSNKITIGNGPNRKTMGSILLVSMQTVEKHPPLYCMHVIHMVNSDLFCMLCAIAYITRAKLDDKIKCQL